MRAKDTVERFQAYAAPLEGRREKLRLDFNENTVGPSPRVVDALRALPPEAYATYPEYGPITTEYAGALGVPALNVGVFNGVDAAIRALFDAYGAQGETFLTTSPTFGYYTPCARLQGMQVVEVPYQDDLSYPEDGVREQLSGKPKLCFICNPNNPTTTLLSSERILSLAAAAPETLVVVDELYADFTGVTVLPQALQLPNVVTLRSFSKTHGLAALRLGFAIGPEAIIERMGRVTGPYDVNMFAVVAGRAALSDPGHVEQYVQEVARAKRYGLAELHRHGRRCFCDGGNYLLVWPRAELASVVSGLDDKGIRVRSMAGKPLIDGSFRLTVGTEAQMRRFFAEYWSLDG